MLLKHETRHFPVLLLALVCGLLSVSANGQSASTVHEGQSVDTIRIGESTESDVIGAYGTDYKLVKHRDHSYEMIYRDRGLSFYYCVSDPLKQIFVVEMEDPARVVTSKGIRLGSSTMKEVFSAYGKPGISTAGFGYGGINFDVEEDDEGEYADDVREPKTMKASTSDASVTSVTATAVETNQNSSIAAGQVNSVNSSMMNVTLDLSSSNVRHTSINDTANNTQSRSARDKAEPAAYLKRQMKEASEKTVRRIELVEASGLRQCHTNYRKDK